ncbi:MAG TPA: hypothetical protein VFV50_01365 [Bdellovibrionales bacterium]|nr:hypothetical protein [Bdellovibrionales bacterium]
MNFDALKEQLLDRLNTILSQIRESSTYIQLREKYEELSPNVQKLLQAAGVLLVLLILFSIPLSNISSSSDYIAQFEEYKQTLRSFLQVQREISQAPDIAPPPPPDQIRARVQQIVTEAGLAPEQVRGIADADVKSDPPTTLVPAAVSQKGVTATLLKLNLKQVLDIGYAIQAIGANVFLTSMDMTANQEDNHYYDVIYRVVGFTVDEPAAPPGGAAPPPGGNKPPPAGGDDE